MIETTQPDQSISLLFPIAEVSPMNLSSKVVQLAHLYMNVIDQQDRGDYSNGFTPEELDRVRTRLHNKFINALRECNVDTSHRGPTTDLARKIQRWMPED